MEARADKAQEARAVQRARTKPDNRKRRGDMQRYRIKDQTICDKLGEIEPERLERYAQCPLD